MLETLCWEDAGTEEPRDQNATSARGHAYWSIGPDTRGWSVELRVVDAQTGDETIDSVRLPNAPSEEAAKRAAQNHENEHFSEVSG